MIKKIISIVVATLMLSSVWTMFASAATVTGATTSDPNNLYECDFESETTLGWTSTTGTFSAGTFDGSNAVKQTAAGSRKQVYTFMSGTTAAPVSSGKLYVGYDIGFESGVSTTMSACGIDFFETYNGTYTNSANGRIYAGNFSVVTENSTVTGIRMGGANANMNGDGGEEALQLSLDKFYRVEWVYDFEATENNFNCYVDGTLFCSRTVGYTQIGSIGLSMAKGMWVDNIRFETNKVSAFDIKKTEVVGGKLEFTFSNPVKTVPQTSDVSIKNLYDGTSVACTDVKRLERNKLSLTLDGTVVANDEYGIKFSENSLVDFYDTNYQNSGNSCTLKEDDTVFALEAVEFKDRQSAISGLMAEVSPVIGEIKLIFNADISPTSVVGAIGIQDETNTLLDSTKYEVAAAGNAVTISLTDMCFFEKSDYKLNISTGLKDISETTALSKEYSIPFKTSEGKIIITGFNYSKADVPIVDTTSLSAGDIIDLNLKVLKPIKEAKNIFLSYGVYSDGMMIDFGIKKISASESATVIEDEISVVVPNKANYKIKGFVWNNVQGLGMIAPAELEK